MSPTDQHGNAIRVIGAADVERLLPMDRCIDVMADALSGLARGDALNPLRSMTSVSREQGIFALMPAALSESRGFGAKVLSVFPGNREVGLESHQGFVVVFEGERGRPTAIMDASAITAIRTAAVSGVATRLLAREEAATLAIIGSGTQARTHLEAMLAVRSISHVRAWSPTRSRLEAFAAAGSERHGVKVEPVASAHEAVDGADVVCTVTASAEPVLLGEWLSPGMHLNAVGYGGPGARELDGEAVRRGRFFVDRRESALNESGDLLLAIRDGAVDESAIVGELGDVLTGAVPGRRAADEITIFESLGLAVEDLAAAAFVAQEAATRGVGTEVVL